MKKRHIIQVVLKTASGNALRHVLGTDDYDRAHRAWERLVSWVKEQDKAIAFGTIAVHDFEVGYTSHYMEYYAGATLFERAHMDYDELDDLFD